MFSIDFGLCSCLQMNEQMKIWHHYYHVISKKKIASNFNICKSLSDKTLNKLEDRDIKEILNTDNWTIDIIGHTHSLSDGNMAVVTLGAHERAPQPILSATRTFFLYLKLSKHPPTLRPSLVVFP